MIRDYYRINHFGLNKLNEQEEVNKTNSTNISKYFGTLMQSIVEIWKIHLKIKKYSKHKALNEYYEDALDAVDSLIEHYQGIYGVIGNFNNSVVNNNGDGINYLKKLRKYIISGRKKLFPNDTELCSDVDELLGIIDSCLYQLQNLK